MLRVWEKSGLPLTADKPHSLMHPSDPNDLLTGNLKSNLVFSPLCREISAAGARVQINIYRLAQSSNWALEIENEQGGVSVFSKPFSNDIDALMTAMYSINVQGIESFLGEPITILH